MTYQRYYIEAFSDPSHRNKRVTCKPDMKEQINKLDTKPGVTNKNIPKSKLRTIHDDV